MMTRTKELENKNRCLKRTNHKLKFKAMNVAVAVKKSGNFILQTREHSQNIDSARHLHSHGLPNV
jgi:hypothetical protein